MIRGFRRTPAGVEQTSAGPADPNDAFDAALALEQQGDLTAAEERYGAADRLGHAGAGVRLGVLLEERDDLAGAEQAFRRADDRGDATGAFHLAWLLQERGDLDGAEDAYRRAETRGHPAAGANLRVLLARRARRRPPTARSPRPRTGAPAPPTARPAAESPPAPPAPGAEAAADATAAATAPAAGVRDPRERRPAGLLLRTASIVLPVAAFAVAFLVGAATRPPVHTQSRLAPATSVSASTVTLSSVATVPAPPKLAGKPPASKTAKPATSNAPGTISLHRVGPAAPVYRAAAPVSTPAAPTGGAATTPSRPTTTVTTAGTRTPSTAPASGQTGSATNGGATPVTGAGSGTTAPSTTPSGG